MTRGKDSTHSQGSLVIRHDLTDVTIAGKKESGSRFLITEITFGTPPRSAPSTAYYLKRYALQFNRFLDGNLRALKLPLDLSSLTAFQQKVLKALSNVPWGETVSYKELAARAGCPDGARAVASVMANNPFPLALPCHRVIASDGTIGGFMKQVKGDAVLLKRKLLENEGVFFDKGGRLLRSSKKR